MTGMASTLVFLLVRHALRLVGLGPKPDDKDVEIAVLRHQLAVLHRQVARPRYAPADRLVLATLARLLPRERWSAFLVTPATLLRWHREAVRRQWTYAREPRIRRGLDPAVVELVLRLARENSRRGLPPDLRGMRQARDEGVGHLGAQHSPAQWPGAGPEEGRSILGRVPSLPGRRCAGMRLLHRPRRLHPPGCTYCSSLSSSAGWCGLAA
jgi:hypothetical protein